jgi:hypothetical protein
MRVFAGSSFALAFGLFVLCGETCLHIEPLVSAPADLSSWPVHVWVAGLFLIYGAVRTRRESLTGGPWLAAGWAFNASLLFGAFVDLFTELLAGTPPPGDEWIPLPIFTILIGILLALSLCGLLGTARAAAEPGDSSDP